MKSSSLRSVELLLFMCELNNGFILGLGLAFASQDGFEKVTVSFPHFYDNMTAPLIPGKVIWVVLWLAIIAVGNANLCANDGVFKFPVHYDESMSGVLTKCSEVSGLEWYITYTDELLRTLQGLKLVDAASYFFRHQWYSEFSNFLNACSASIRHSHPNISSDEADYLFYAALVTNPYNSVVVKNFAFMLEIRGCGELSNSLLEQSIRLNHYAEPDAGVILHHIFTATSYIGDELSALKLFHRIVVRALSLLQQYSTDVTRYKSHPFYEIRALQASYHYLGVSPGIIAELYARVLYHQYPSFYSVPLPRDSYQRPVVYKLGIVSEFHENSSPGLCLTVCSSFCEIFG
jgi:hypothetical protein